MLVACSYTLTPQYHNIDMIHVLALTTKTFSYLPFDTVPVDRTTCDFFGNCHTEARLQTTIFAYQHRKTAVRNLPCAGKDMLKVSLADQSSVSRKGLLSVNDHNGFPPASNY